MENIKVRVNNEAESKEVQELLFELGYKWIDIGAVYYKISPNFKYITAYHDGKTLAQGNGMDAKKQITLPQLRDLVVLKRNCVEDATHECKQEPEFKYRLINNHWYVITDNNKQWRKDSIQLEEAPLFIKPIEKKEMKEFLVNHDDKWTLQLLDADTEENSFRVAVPSGAECMTKHLNHKVFWKDGAVNFINADKGWDYNYSLTLSDYLNAWGGKPEIVWQRHTQPEELPFIDDLSKWFNPEQQKLIAESGKKLAGILKDMSISIKPKSLNDTYAEIEQVRHSHYFKDVSDIDKMDVYDVLKRFEVTDPCLQHIVKKALCAGQRGHKDFKKDLQDILDTAVRAVDINK